MSRSFTHILIKTLKVTGISLAAIIILIFLLPFMFPGFVSDKIKALANTSINSELNFSKARLSFFNHFPSLTLTLYDFNLKGSAPFQKDTLVSADEVALGIDLKSLLSKKVKVREIYLSKAFINIQVDSSGRANYNVYKSKSSAPSNKPVDDTLGTSLQIEKILVEQSNIVYNDRSLPMQIKATGFYYLGKGDLSKDIFDLTTHTEIDSLDFIYNNQEYLSSKKITADLVTSVNTNSLSFYFEKNDLKINQLPVEFTGNFSFIKGGYAMDFKLKALDTDLHNVFSALPASYLSKLDKTDIRGSSDISLNLSGNYIAATNTMPGLQFNMKIRDGYIANPAAPAPVKNLFVNFETSLPGMNPDSLSVNIDSIFFNIDKDYFSSIIKIKGVHNPYIFAKINTALDLDKWSKAFAIEPFAVKGNYSLHLLADGRYATKVEHSGVRQVDTVISSIPKFTLQSSLQNGYFKYASLPQSVNNINFNITASCPDNNYEHAQLSANNINATVLSNFIKGYINIKNGEVPNVDANFQTVFHLADVKQFYPVDSLDIAGDVNINIKTKGRYSAAKRLFPVTQASIVMNNGFVKTKYYPHPLQNINVDANITNSDGTVKTLKINLKPISFTFENQPFTLKANLQNFDDLKYNISSNGSIDLGKIYKVFARNGYNVTGIIQTNLSLQGLQSDAVAGHYDKLFNKGTLTIKNIQLSSELFPKPFNIKTGLFRFDQDKMWFDQFNAVYGSNAITLNGFLNNVIGYATQKNEALKGELSFSSNHVLVDEFMAFAGNTNSTATAVKPAAGAASTGVVMVPTNLSITFNADAKVVSYQGLDIKDFKGQMVIDSGKIKLNKTGFVIVGAPVDMDASYSSITPAKALFDYHISVKEFDIKKAYDSIKLFHDLATSASSAEGIVGLDYNLAGRLDANMHPVYPSLKGGGTLTIKKVKIKGLKLFGAVSKATDKNDINDPDLSKVEIKTKIENNIITISRTKMRIFGFRPRFEGQVSFNGNLNLQFRLGLPPLGIFGIPMSITGTEDNPKIKLGKSSQELQETEDDDKQ